MKRIAIAALLAAAGACALAQTFPAKPVRIVVAFPAGGARTSSRACSRPGSPTSGASR